MRLTARRGAMSSAVSPPPPLRRPSVEEQMRLDKAVRRPDGAADGCSCLIWAAGKRVRFRGAYWLPHRLLYALHAPGNAACMAGKPLDRTCQTPGCVQARHQAIGAYKPPAKRPGSLGKKAAKAEKRARPLDDTAVAAAAAAEQRRNDVAMRVRAELVKLQATLAAIDAANGDADAELAALREGTGLATDEVILPDDAGERAALLALEQDPFAAIRRRLRMAQ